MYISHILIGNRRVFFFVFYNTIEKVEIMIWCDLTSVATSKIAIKKKMRWDMWIAIPAYTLLRKYYSYYAIQSYSINPYIIYSKSQIIFILYSKKLKLYFIYSKRKKLTLTKRETILLLAFFISFIEIRFHSESIYFFGTQSI